MVQSRFGHRAENGFQIRGQFFACRANISSLLVSKPHFLQIFLSDSASLIGSSFTEAIGSAS